VTAQPGHDEVVQWLRGTTSGELRGTPGLGTRPIRSHHRPTAVRRLGVIFGFYRQAFGARAVAAPRIVLPRARPSAIRTLPRSIGILGVAALLVVCCIGISCGMLWWRLSGGPLSVDTVTPWLTSALEERLGGRHHIEVGGTQIELTEEGRAAVRLRDIIVRDHDGAIVASAPKAEVGLSGTALLTGHLRADRLSLIGAAMAVRVEQDGELTVFAGADQRPIATAGAGAVRPESAGEASKGNAPAPPLVGQPEANPPLVQQPATADGLSRLLAWLKDIDTLGLDGHDLAEIGLKNGSLSVDDMRTGKRWHFNDINLSLRCPRNGAVTFSINSKGADGPWSVTATMTPRGDGGRAVEAVVRDLSPKDLMLALRLNDGDFDATMPISAVLRGEIKPDGFLQTAEGRVVLGAGYFGHPHDAEDRVVIDQAQVELRWDAEKRQVTLPIELVAGANRISLVGVVDAPAQAGGAWEFSVDHGAVMLASAAHVREAPLVLDRVVMTGRVDMAKHRLELDRGDIGGTSANLAFSGVLDFSGPNARLESGLAATPMSASALKRIWPVFIQTKVRQWMLEHIPGGTVDKLVIATNATLAELRSGGPPVPNDGVSIDLLGSGVQLQPITNLPLVLRDADLAMHVRGRHVMVTIGRSTGDLPSGRKLMASNVNFEVPDTLPKEPPSQMHFKVDGAVDGVAELLGMDLFRDAVGLQLDPATSHGTVSASVLLRMPITHAMTQDKLNYAVEADFVNLSAEHLIHNFKVEASALHVSGNPQWIEVKGDARIAGTLASIDYRMPIGGGDAEVRAQATIDDATRTRMGIDPNGALSGPIPLKVVGKIGSGEHDSRFNVEVDLTQAKIVDLLPGWNKPAGTATHANLVVTDKQRFTRFEDIVIEGPGTLVKGFVELGNDGNITQANFSNFSLSDGDKASLKAERSADGMLKVSMRGDVYDGRGFVKGSLSGAALAEKQKTAAVDLDLDVRVGVVAGFNGDALRGVDLKLTRRGGQIRNFSLNARLGRDATLTGDLRAYNGHRVIYLETNDAGALCRFTDTYPRIIGGQMWVAMDPPSGDHSPQEGLLDVRQFVVHGEPALSRIASGDASGNVAGRSVFGHNSQDVDFTHLRVTFTRSPGRLALRDGVVWGPAMGATIEGVLDYARENVRMRGTFVPVYGLNNMFVHLPLVGPILGGENEGLFGITYEVVGSPHAPELRINPISTLALGPLRKLFEFRGVEDTDSLSMRSTGRAN
jgi:hypothetical protein